MVCPRRVWFVRLPAAIDVLARPSYNVSTPSLDPASSSRRRTWKALLRRKTRSYASLGGRRLSASWTVSFSSGIRSSARRPAGSGEYRDTCSSSWSYLIFDILRHWRTSLPGASSIASAMAERGYMVQVKEQTYWRASVVLLSMLSSSQGRIEASMMLFDALRVVGVMSWRPSLFLWATGRSSTWACISQSSKKLPRLPIPCCTILGATAAHRRTIYNL
jgi:hypothetical protein